MGKMNDPFKFARIERFSRSRHHAEIVINTALLVCEARTSTESQVADLAAAVDALAAGQFHLATALAEAAIEGRSKLRTAERSATMARSLSDVRAMMAELIQAGAAGQHQDF
jgi:hypothetical protein